MTNSTRAVEFIGLIVRSTLMPAMGIAIPVMLLKVISEFNVHAIADIEILERASLTIVAALY